MSKPLRAAIVSVMKKKVETKTINVRDPNSFLPANTVSLAYNAAVGLQYLAVDLFKCTQGPADSSTLSSQNNRLGDKIQGVGFNMDYYFHTRGYYSISGASYFIPFVKVRILVFKTAYGLTNPTYNTLYNNNFLNGESFTQHPIDWDEGYVKEVLHDEVIIIRNQYNATGASIIPNSQLVHNSVYHFKKYIKYDRPIKFMDNNSSDPNGTDKPIFIAISAEIDDSWVGGIPPSDTPLMTTTGYTQAWFKDA